MTNKQGILIGALGSYFNELIAENLRPIVERIDNLSGHLNVDIKKRFESFDRRIDELESKALYQKGYSEGQTLRIDELEKQVSLLRDRPCDHSARVRGIAQEEIRKHLDSDAFRRRIFEIVDMALQQATLSIKGSE